MVSGAFSWSPCRCLHRRQPIWLSPNYTYRGQPLPHRLRELLALAQRQAPLRCQKNRRSRRLHLRRVRPSQARLEDSLAQLAELPARLPPLQCCRHLHQLQQVATSQPSSARSMPTRVERAQVAPASLRLHHHPSRQRLQAARRCLVHSRWASLVLRKPWDPCLSEARQAAGPGTHACIASGSWTLWRLAWLQTTRLDSTMHALRSTSKIPMLPRSTMQRTQQRVSGH